MCAQSFLMCARFTACVRARALAHLRVNIVNDLFSQVLAFCSYAAECIPSAQVNNNNAMNFSTLFFSSRPYLISSFHDSVASPGNDVRGARCEFFSPPLPGFFLVNLFT